MVGDRLGDTGRSAAGLCWPELPGDNDNLDPRFSIERHRWTITICISGDWLIHPPTPSMVTSCLQTLLHEMVHAVFAIYTCDCAHGCEQNIAEAHHNVHFQAVIQALESTDERPEILLGTCNRFHPSVVCRVSRTDFRRLDPVA